MSESFWKILSAKLFKAATVKKLRPEDTARHVSEFAPTHTCRKSGSDETSRAGSGDISDLHSGFHQSLDDSDMCQAAHRAAAQGKPDALPIHKIIHTNTHQEKESVGFNAQKQNISDAIRRLEIIESLHEQSGPKHFYTAKELGRNLFTRIQDHLSTTARTYLPPLHWLIAYVFALLLFLYARLVTKTMRLKTGGLYAWPDIPAPCVLALWHNNVQSLIAVCASKLPKQPLLIMVSQVPRADSLSIFCRMLGLRVVRGNGRGGWEALSQLALEIERGACVVITADGGGPARTAKVGAIALASATGAPLITLGASCHPALIEKHTWDTARNPLPLSSIAVTVGPMKHVPVITAVEVLQEAQIWFHNALNEAEESARQMIDITKP